MAVLRNDAFARRPRTRRREKRDLLSGIVSLALILASLALLVLSRFDHAWVRAIRSHTIEAVAPVLEMTSRPAAHFQRLRSEMRAYGAVLEELDRVRQENQKLRQWQWRARQLEAEVDGLRAIVNGVKDVGFGFVTARVVAETRGPFARSALVNAGSLKGVREGQVAVNADGLVGRTVDVNERAARVLLLTDLSSRVPVLIGTAARAVLRGDNSELLRVEFLPREMTIKPGDVVTTSGDDGLLPPGLRIGTVERVGDDTVVRPFARLDGLDYVSVLFFEAPGLTLLKPEARFEPAARLVEAQ